MEEIKAGTAVEDPNVFNFMFDNLYTTVKLDSGNLTIIKVKKDEKKKTEHQVGSPVSIAISAIESIKKTKFFSISIFIGAIVAGLGIGGILGLIFGISVTLIVGAISIFIGIFFAFQKMIVIKRKDGSKFPIKFGDDKDLERFLNSVFR